MYMLMDSDFHTKFTGHCLDASKLVMAMLAQRNVKSHLQECCALLTHHKHNELIQLYAIGFYTTHEEGRMATHWVTITETEPTLIIDVSIGHLLLNEQKVILECAYDEMILGNYSYEQFNLTYIRK
jgi:hypothetical protein